MSLLCIKYNKTTKKKIEKKNKNKKKSYDNKKSFKL